MSYSFPIPRSSSNPAKGVTTPQEPPLGNRNPLLPPTPLGQNFISPKFLSPLGSQPLTTNNSLALSRQEMPSYSLPENSFDDSPVSVDFPLSPSSQPEIVQPYEASFNSEAVGATPQNQTVVQPFSETGFSDAGKAAIREATEASPTSVPTESAATEFGAEGITSSALTAVQRASEAQSSETTTEVFSVAPQLVQTSLSTELDSEGIAVHPSSLNPESVTDHSPREIPTVVQAFSETESPQPSASAEPEITTAESRSLPTEPQSEANLASSPLAPER